MNALYNTTDLTKLSPYLLAKPVCPDIDGAVHIGPNKAIKVWKRDLHVRPQFSYQTSWIEIKYSIARSANNDLGLDRIRITFKENRRSELVLDSDRLIWSSNSTTFADSYDVNGFEWQQQRILIPITQSATIEFKWNFVGFNPMLSVKDTVIRQSHLDRPFYCSFGETFCWFTHAPNIYRGFRLGDASITSSAPKVFGDQLQFLSTFKGNFLHTELNMAEAQETRHLQLKSNYFKPSREGGLCVTLTVASVFGPYNQDGGRLRLLTEEFSNGHVEVLMYLDRSTIGWAHFQLSATVRSNFRFVLDAEQNPDVWFAVRDFSFNLRECVDDKAHSAVGQVDALSCDFDVDQCGWRNQRTRFWEMGADKTTPPDDATGTSHSNLLVK
jgi:hypothetical protein